MTLLSGNKRAFRVGGEPYGPRWFEIEEAIEDGNAWRINVVDLPSKMMTSLKITVAELEALGLWATEAAARRRAGQ